MTKANILLVDDRPANLLALEAILDGLGLNLVRARSGEEALRLLEAGDFAAVLLDVQMPGMDGFETARLIRSRERGGRTPILFVTAHEGDRAWVERAYALGAVDYLVKPLVPVIVRAKVAGFVELFEKTKEVLRQADELRRWDRRGFEQRLAEEGVRLRQSEEQFRTLADSIPQLAWMARPDGHIFWYNRRWYEYTGTTPEQMEGWGWQSVHDPAELPRVLANWKAASPAASPGRTRSRCGGTTARCGGTCPEPCRCGTTTAGWSGWFGTNTDIEDRRRDVERMRAAKEEAEAALRAKDHFLAVLSHELRTPLTPVLAAASALEAGPTWTPTLRDDLGVIRRNVELEARLIDDLLDLTRSAAGRGPAAPGGRGRPRRLRAALEACRPTIEAKRLEVTLEPWAGRPHVWADPARLQQVFWNLINNAVKFTPEGGRITLRSADDAGRSAGDPGGRHRRRDRAGGAAADLRRLRAGRADGASGPGRAGAGPGLSRRLVELHGGTLTAASEGQGPGGDVHPGVGHDRRRRPSRPRRLPSPAGTEPARGCRSCWSRTTRTRCGSSPGCWSGWATPSGPPGASARRWSWPTGSGSTCWSATSACPTAAGWT